MKKFTSLTVVALALIGFVLVSGRSEAVALPLPPAQPINTPAAPDSGGGSTVSQMPSSLTTTAMPERTQPGPAVAEQLVWDEAHLQRVQVLRHAGEPFEVAAAAAGVTGSAAPQGVSERCIQVILNSEMDVVEFGDGTGSVDYWSILWQIIYFDNRPGYYNSPVHALVMGDDPVVPIPDTDIINPTLDYDAFGQGFQAPFGLTSVTVYYSRLYEGENTDDDAWGNLWTLDGDGYLDQLVVYWGIGATPTGWSNRFVSITDAGVLATLSGQPLALVFDNEADRASPYEFIWLDDALAVLCYDLPHAVHLPLVIKSPPTQYGCTPYEPDSVSQRGSTVVGATCSGSFGATDIKDYYSLDLNGVTNVRLELRNLPPGTNWDAMIYEDTAGYPLACHIGTPGDQDKGVDCPALSLGRNYFVLVTAGTAPSGGSNTYQMSVTSR